MSLYNGTTLIARGSVAGQSGCSMGSTISSISDKFEISGENGEYLF